MNKILLSLFLVIALMGTAWANNGWYSTLQGTASDVQQSPPPNGVTIAYNTTDHEWEFNYGLAPAGGTTGTCLEKNSNSDYDYSWVACSGGGGSNLWVESPGNVGINTFQNVGIGTNTPLNSQLVVKGNIQINGSGAGNLYSPNGLEFDPNNSTGTSLNPAVTMLTTGNVGIGTGNNTPSATLHVLGNTFLSQSPNFNSNELTFDANGNNFMALYTPGGTTDSILKFGPTTNKNVLPSASIMSIDFDTNNVGIGTENPNSLFYVNGTALVQGLKIPGNSVANGYVWTSTGATGAGVWAAAAGGANFWLNNGGSNVGINTTQAVGIGTSFVGGTGEATLSVMNGNVGIGTWVPGAQLDVEGTLSIASFGGNVGIGTLSPQAQLDVENSVNQNNILNYGGGNLGIGTITTQALVTVGSTGQSVITSTGNVGIGTKTPQKNLDVYTGTENFVDAGNVGVSYQINSQHIGSPSADDRLVINSTGAPNSTRLWIDGSGTTVGLSMAQAGSEELFFGAQSGSGYMAYYGTFLFKNSGNTSEAALNQSGNWFLGGSTAPVNRLDVSGAQVIGATYAGTNTAPSNGLLVQGNVGIGSVNPGQALDVNGTLRALSSGTCSYLYKCVGGVDAGVIQTSACNLCPAGSCTQMNGCF